MANDPVESIIKGTGLTEAEQEIVAERLHNKEGAGRLLEAIYGDQKPVPDGPWLHTWSPPDEEDDELWYPTATLVTDDTREETHDHDHPGVRP